MRGWAALWQQPTKESTTSARDYLERVLNIEPQDAEAMVGIAYARHRALVYGWSSTEDTYFAQLDLIMKATAINPRYAFGYYVESMLFFLTKQLPQAVEAARMSVALDPNAAHGYYALGLAEGPAGHCEQGITHIKKAFALNKTGNRYGVYSV